MTFLSLLPPRAHPSYLNKLKYLLTVLYKTIYFILSHFCLLNIALKIYCPTAKKKKKEKKFHLDIFLNKECMGK